jgi:TusE/DsrC/DsvC family sulfur relay protein
MARSTAAQESRVQTAITTDAAAISETPVEVDERGFMADPSEWSPGAALFLARRQGVDGWPRELASDHWRVIDFMRTYYETTGNAPSLRYTCKALGMARKRFSRLFPGGLMTARRIAGLPGPRKAANRREQLLTRDWWGFLTGR